MFKPRLRITQKDRLLIALVSAFFALLLLIVFGTRMTRNDEHQICLLLQGTATQLIDPYPGFSAPDRRFHMADVQTYGYTTGSPDQRHTAYFYQDPQRPNIWQIYMGSAGSSSLTFLQESAKSDEYYWSHDSRSLAYVWDSEDKQTYLRIFNVDGSNSRTISLGAERSRIIYRYGWSPDDAYLAFAVQSVPQPGTDSTYSLKWLSIAELQWISYSMPALEEPRKLGWSPVGHQFYWIRHTANLVELSVLSPTGLKTIPLPYSGTTSITQILWSPNDHYILLRVSIYSSSNQQPAKPVEHMLVIDMSGEKLSKTAEFETPINYSGPPYIWWSKNGQTFMFLVYTSTFQSELLAFQIAENRMQTIATNIVPTFTTVINGPEGTRIIILHPDQEGAWNFDVIDSDGILQGRLYHSSDKNLATYANAKIFVSPDFRRVALLFAQNNSGVAVWAWLDAQIEPHYIRETQANALSGATWTENSRWLIYVEALFSPNGNQDSTVTIIVDTQTGDVHRLSGYPTVSRPLDHQLISENQPLELYAMGSGATTSLETYTLDGKLLYRFNSLSKQDMNSRGYVVATAPDHHAALLAFDPLGANPIGANSLQFSWSDGRPPRVIDPDINVDWMSWTPDSTMVVVTYEDSNGAYHIRVFGSEGEEVWSTAHIEYEDLDSLSWIACK